MQTDFYTTTANAPSMCVQYPHLVGRNRAEQLGFDLTPKLSGCGGPRALTMSHSPAEVEHARRDSSAAWGPCMGKLSGTTAPPMALAVAQRCRESDAQDEVMPRCPSLFTGLRGPAAPPAAVVVGDLGMPGGLSPPMDYWRKYESNMRTYR